MKPERFCQSCGMPLDTPETHGREADGSISQQFCRYCYSNGHFSQPDMTLEQMRRSVIQKMENEEIPEDIIETVVVRLPDLSRWKQDPRSVETRIATSDEEAV